MTPRSRKVAVFVGTAALAAGAGIGVAASGNSDAATTPSTPGMLRGGGPGSPGDLSTLADDLGVSETRLREAMESLRSSGRPQDLAAALAEELGVSEDKVRDALESAVPGGGPPGGGAPPSGGAPPAGGGQTAPAPGTTSQS
jgi:hypothetical protein